MVPWLVKSNIDVRAVGYLRWISYALILAIAAWILDQSWNSGASPVHVSTTFGITRVRDIFGLRMGVAMAAAIVWWFVHSSRTAWTSTLLSGALLTVSLCLLPPAFKQSRALAAAGDIAEFSDWEKAIPPTSTVLITPSRDVGTFVWFTLQRPNYLAVDQSAGVVFSRRTALEIQRRSQVLLPIMDPNWTILTNLRTSPGKRTIDVPTRPLTATTLSQICTDLQLGFVISRHDIGIEHVNHQNIGSWRDWNLYDCRNVRSPPK